MGASISTIVTSWGARDRMLDFLSKHYRDWTQVSGTPGARLVGGGKEVFDYMGSRGERVAIGTEYLGNLYGWERCYVTALCRWVALKIGRKRVRFSKDVIGPEPFAKPVPYLLYDSYEYWPILVMSEKAALKLPEKRQWCAVDKFGCYLGAEIHESVVSAAFDLISSNDKRYKAYAKDANRFGPVPSESEARLAWLDKQRVVKAKHAKPEVERVLPVLRGELERLDRLWRKHAC